jgi:hypothetical protein
MSLMLVAIIAAVGVAMFSREWGRRQNVLCAGIAIAMTLLYYFRPQYMT